MGYEQRSDVSKIITRKLKRDLDSSFREYFPLLRATKQHMPITVIN